MGVMSVSTAGQLYSSFAAAKGGDVITLENGNYGWLSLKNGDFQSHVTIRPAAGARPYIANLSVTNSRRVRFEGLAVEVGPDQSGQIYAGEVRGSSEIKFERCTFIGGRHVNRSKWDTCSRGLRIYDNSADIGVEKCEFSFFSRAPQVQWVSNVVIRGAIARDCRSDMLFFQSSKKITIEGCTLTDIYRQGVDHADFIQFDSRDGVVCSDIIVRNVVALRGRGNGETQIVFFGNKTALQHETYWSIV